MSGRALVRIHAPDTDLQTNLTMDIRIWPSSAHKPDHAYWHLILRCKRPFSSTPSSDTGLGTRLISDTRIWHIPRTIKIIGPHSWHWSMDELDHGYLHLMLLWKRSWSWISASDISLFTKQIMYTSVLHCSTNKPDREKKHLGLLSEWTWSRILTSDTALWPIIDMDTFILHCSMNKTSYGYPHLTLLCGRVWPWIPASHTDVQANMNISNQI